MYIFARLAGLALGKDAAIREDVWHKHFALFPVRLVDGRYSSSLKQLWRRKLNGQWEYRQDPITDDDIEGDAW